MTSVGQAELVRIGDALEAAARRDLRRASPRAKSQRRHMFVAVAAALLLLGAVAAGIAASVLKTAAQEEQGLLDGAATFAGTNPKCVQFSNIHLHCVLAHAPTELTFSPAASYRGVKMESVDSTKHVDGGCVATSDDGRIWECYLGDEAVRRGLIGKDFLGQYLPEPPHG
jgi:hypothetical protein